MIKKLFKILIKLVVILLILLLIGVVAAGLWFNHYLQDNETKIIDNLELLNKGTIQFDNVCLSFWNSFPDASVELTNVLLYDSLYHLHETPILQAEKTVLFLNLKDWRTKALEVNRVEFSDGILNVFRDSEDYTNVLSILHNNKSERPPKPQQITVKTKELSIGMRNMRLNLSDAIRTTHINGMANKLEINLLQTKPMLEVKLETDLAMDSMSFKRTDGSFLRNSTLKGEFHLVDTKSKLLVKPMKLEVGEQQFDFEATIFKSMERPSKLVFTNPETDFAACQPILPKKLQNNLSGFGFTGLLDTKTTVYTTFQQGEFPRITIDYKLKNNDVRVNKLNFKDVTLEGRFVNENYHKDGSKMEGKNILIQARSIDCMYDGFKIQADTLTIEDGLDRYAYMKSNAVITGKAEEISRWLNNDKFLFRKGTFKLVANVKGGLNKRELILIESNADLELKDVKVVYAPSNTAFFIDQLLLEKKEGDANFQIKSRVPIINQQYALNGGIKNIEKLLVTGSKKELSSNVSIYADRLGWKDFIDMFGEDGYLKSDKSITGAPSNTELAEVVVSSSRSDVQKKRSMKETVIGINSSFRPKIDLEVGMLNYYNYLDLKNFKTGLYFEGDHTLVLEETSFDVANGEVKLDAEIEVQEDLYSTFKLNLTTTSINLQTLLPPLNYLKIKLLKDLSELPDDLSLDVELEGVLHDTLGPVPGSLSGHVKFQSKNDAAFKGRVEFKPTVVTKDINAKPKFATKLYLEGDPFLFNDFFKTVDFLFDHGTFDVAIDYKGDVTSVEDLMTKTNIKLNIRNTAITYAVADVKFPIKFLNVNLSDDIADLSIELQPAQFPHPVNFKGRVENLSEIVLGNTGKETKVTASVFSEQIDWKNIYQLIPSTENSEEASITSSPSFSPAAVALNPSALKNTVNGLLGKFNPSIRLRVNTFNYNEKIQLRNLIAGVKMKEKGTLELEATGFEFKNSRIQVLAEMGLDKETETPFLANFFTKNLDIAQSLSALDYLGIESVRKIKKLEGLIDLNLNLSGSMNDVQGGLIKNKTKGVLDFTLSKIEVEGLAILDSITNRVILRKRFKNLRFSPIVSKLVLDGDHVRIPVTEVQSNALHFFVEGDVQTEDRSNVWITIPFSNLLRRDLDLIPDKKGYAGVRDKLFIEITTEQNKPKFKFRISKNKYYKDRKMQHLYKEEKNSDRKFRKNNRPVNKFWEIIRKNRQ